MPADQQSCQRLSTLYTHFAQMSLLALEQLRHLIRDGGRRDAFDHTANL